MLSIVPVYLALAGLASVASAHIAFWHKSMYGFNVTDKTFPYDNRPQVPLYNMDFDQWWLHGHKDYPPNEGDFFELPAGGKVNSELSCDKGATSNWPSSQGGDVGYGSNWPCPGAQPSAFHTTGESDVKGCALAIAYQSDVNALQPDDFTIFSVNHTCVWYLNTEFEVPKLPACPEGGCHCAWFWIHSIDSGSEQIYMNAFKCKVTGDAGNQPLGKPALPRRCGADPTNGRPNATPGNCTVGAKLPMYWYQKEGNNMFEGTYEAPYYNDLYGFSDGAQNDVFNDGVIASLASFSVSSHAASATSAVASHASSILSSVPTSVQHSSSATPTSQAAPSTHAAPSSSAAPPPSETPSATSTTRSSSSTGKCKPRDSKKKRSENAKRHHSRHLSGLHH
ncbi:hypothetical protein BD309DRAFT_206196 [Dichomitus squalens]|uniref:Uncharacterized protein n=1 Tax=Dichomitus squalens TaxID=114155 RepID=A0A4Q9PU14_9APHY|nr:uncharacterized protein DICSQDRAFT_80885 [Dichomitus squalens LYAD-421 SS1]EJF64983.1 hypothetical protein DICSQDRAFT_80885 [Dichomitus squalens LYAD-421 SS1]TBU48895.1 hypothetical protein BD309DRAFT_206196 [Dichomitus squalens]TBU57966.1 hypothetical protein BD310DRAFT_906795 [Dichomitus squalens]